MLTRTPLRSGERVIALAWFATPFIMTSRVNDQAATALASSGAFSRER